MKTNRIINAAAVALAALLLFAAAPAETHAAGGADVSNFAPASAKRAPSTAEKEWGVKVVGVRLTAMGQFLDFRYRVVDAEKAAAILDRNNVPRVVVEGTGQEVNVAALPKVGRLRQDTRAPKVGRVYFMMFKNPGTVRAGDTVSIVVGGFRIHNIPVEG